MEGDGHGDAVDEMGMAGRGCLSFALIPELLPVISEWRI